MTNRAMNTERLLAHYERIAEAPDAIARLRRFILDLAVHGKLVPQDPEDEAASELLKRIAAEKVRLVRAGKIREPKVLPVLSDVPFPLPANWRWSQIAEIGLLNPRNDAMDSLMTSFVPMPLIAAEYKVHNGHEVRFWGEIKKGYTHFAEGDVGLAKITPCFENGKSTVFRKLAGGIGSGTTELHIVRPLFVDADYILIFLKCPHFIETGIPRMTGTAGQKRVPTEYFAHSPFPLPPVAEQHRIVTKVDELMALCDRLEAARAARETTRDLLAAASLARLNEPDPETFQADARFAFDALPSLTARPDQIKQLRQAILSLAVRGRLVPQDPRAEPASVLLTKLLRVRGELVASKKLRQSLELSNTIANREQIDVPPSWVWAKCDQLMFVTKLAGFEYTKHFELKPSGQVPVIRAQNVRPWRIDPSNLLFLKREVSELLERSALTKPCLLMTFIGAGIGDVAYFDENIRWHLAPNVAKIEPLPGCEEYLDLRYILLFLISPFGRSEIFKHIKATAQPSTSMGTIRDIDFAIPPLAEQHDIVAKVDELMVLCDQLEASLTATDATRSQLLEALLHEALAPAARTVDAAAE